MTNLQKAQAIFKTYPDQDEVHITGDGEAFVNEHAARAHRADFESFKRVEVKKADATADNIAKSGPVAPSEEVKPPVAPEKKEAPKKAATSKVLEKK